jgi:hypothetical protein
MFVPGHKPADSPPPGSRTAAQKTGGNRTPDHEAGERRHPDGWRLQPLREKFPSLGRRSLNRGDRLLLLAGVVAV